MHATELRRLLDAALDKAPNRISLTLTNLPSGELQMMTLVEGALGAARRYGAPLAEVQFCLARFPGLKRLFSHTRVSDCDDPEVLRLIYEPDTEPEASSSSRGAFAEAMEP